MVILLVEGVVVLYIWQIINLDYQEVVVGKKEVVCWCIYLCLYVDM